MPFSDYTLESLAPRLGIQFDEANLFLQRPSPDVPAWLIEFLARGTRLALISEKARSEFIVAPILMASRELSPVPVAIFSGQRLDVDPSRGLVGECDFILARSPSLPPLQAPIAIIIEASKHDIEGGMGQCVAQMFAAAIFNTTANRDGSLYGCVTSGEVWQFLRLENSLVSVDQKRYYLDDLSGILGAFQVIIAADGRDTSR